MQILKTSNCGRTLAFILLHSETSKDKSLLVLQKIKTTKILVIAILFKLTKKILYEILMSGRNCINS